MTTGKNTSKVTEFKQAILGLNSDKYVFNESYNALVAIHNELSENKLAMRSYFNSKLFLKYAEYSNSIGSLIEYSIDRNAIVMDE